MGSISRILVIVGPTASGKSGLAVELAKRLTGEVISADSRQIYRGLDIGTEKTTLREMRGVPHHCIDIASPKRAMSVAGWRKHAERAIRDMVRRGKLPIVAGGTGLYLDALVYGTEFPSVKPNARARRELEKLNTDELYARLKVLDPERAGTIEARNPRRLIRAIEIATALGKVPMEASRVPRYNVTWIGLNPGLPELEKRLERRLDRSLRKGLVAETKGLRTKLHLSWKRINELGLEYRTAGAYIRGEIDRTEMRATMLRELRRYAKRQLAWFKRNKDIAWYPSTTGLAQKVVTLFFTDPRP